jgi:basic membrane protein A
VQAMDPIFRSRRLWIGVALLFLFFPALAALQGDELKVALVLPGSISDHGFNEVAYQGLQDIQKQFNAKIAYSENTALVNYERVIRSFADDGNKIIFCRGLEFGDLAKKIAPDYPQQYFIVSDGHEVRGPNVISIEPRTRDAAFLCGVMAGLTTKTNKVGAVIGFDFPLIVGDVEAFRWGLRSSNPKAELQVIYLGTFDDVSKGREAALSEIGSGCDILYHIADTAGMGVIQAAADKGAYVIGYGSDQNHLAPKTVIATEISDPRFMMVDTVRLIQEGKFDGHDRIYGVESPSVACAVAPGFISPATQAKLDQVKARIVSGQLQIPLLTARDAGAKLPVVHL